MNFVVKSTGSSTGGHSTYTDDPYVVTDDHYSSSHSLHNSSHHGAHPEGIFGSLHYIDPVTGCLSLIIIIFAVYIVESLFHELHRYTDDTPFQDMIASIEKELMIVGCMAFIFKVILMNNNFLSAGWLHALEYADTVVPIVSFCFCGQGLFLILTSIHSCSQWSKAYHLLPEEIQLEYLQTIKNGYNISYFIKMFQIRTEMEFKVFHEIFCVHHHIKRFSIAFDVYVERVFERYLVSTISIEPMDWAIICVGALMNWGRKDLDMEYSDCGSMDEVNCWEKNDLIIFTLAGACIFSITLFLAIQSRYYELKFLASVGVTSVDDCFTYLNSCDSIVHEPKRQQQFSVDDVKAALQAIRLSDGHGEGHGEGSRVIHMVVSLLISIGSLLLRLALSCLTGLLTICNGRKRRKSMFEDDGFSFKSKRVVSSRSDFDRNMSGASNLSDGDKLGDQEADGGGLTSFVRAIMSKKKPVGQSAAHVKRVVPFVSPVKVDLQYSSLEALPARDDEVHARGRGDSDSGSERALGSPSGLRTGSDLYKPAIRLSDWKNGIAPGALSHGSTSISNHANDGKYVPARRTTTTATMSAPWTLSGHSITESAKTADDSLPVRQLMQSSVKEPAHQAPMRLNRKSSSERRLQVDDSVLGRLESNHAPAAQMSSWKHGQAPGALSHGSNAIKHMATGRLDSGPQQGCPPVSESHKDKGKRRFSTGASIGSLPTLLESYLPHIMASRSLEEGECTDHWSVKEAFHDKAKSAEDKSGTIEKMVELAEEKVSRLFLFHWPELYFRTVMIQVMVISFYLALWITNFIVVALRLRNGSMWAICSFLPGLCSALLYLYVVKCAALLKAMTSLDHDALSEVIEQTEASSVLGEEVRKKLLSKLPGIRDPEVELKVLFNQISSDGSSTLKRREFQQLLSKMEINFSRKKWALIFKEVDHNFDDEISLQELFLFIFPDHDKALRSETRRLKIIAERIRRMQKSMISLEGHSPHTASASQASGPSSASSSAPASTPQSEELMIRKMRRTSIMTSGVASNKAVFSGKTEAVAGGAASGAGVSGSASPSTASDLAEKLSRLAPLTPLAAIPMSDSSESSDDEASNLTPSKAIIVSARKITSNKSRGDTSPCPTPVPLSAQNSAGSVKVDMAFSAQSSCNSGRQETFPASDESKSAWGATGSLDSESMQSCPIVVFAANAKPATAAGTATVPSEDGSGAVGSAELLTAQSLHTPDASSEEAVRAMLLAHKHEVDSTTAEVVSRIESLESKLLAQNSAIMDAMTKREKRHRSPEARRRGDRSAEVGAVEGEGVIIMEC